MLQAVNDRLAPGQLRLLRYAGVSAVTVVFTQAVLFSAYGVGITGALANVIAVTLGAVPNYLLNRAWVWERSGSHDVWREIVPFWTYALLGLVVSTIVVAWADARWGHRRGRLDRQPRHLLRAVDRQVRVPRPAPLRWSHEGRPRLMVRADLLAAARAARGFLPDDEGRALHDAALAVTVAGPWMEIGSYCGKSGVWLGAAALERGATLFTIDHHRGSEEMQAGWEHHDDSLVDDTGRMDSLPVFRRTIRDAGLEDVVVAIVGRSTTVARHWAAPLAFLFIDGGHAGEVAHADYDAWVPSVAPGATLAIHDVFADPADGGRPPYELWLRALDDGFDQVSATGSLRVLRRGAP
ncbi:MAG: class I SAM-dependent methyltransferase [Actinomycetota bacterium]